MVKRIILGSIKVVLLLFVLVTILLPLFNIKPSSVISDSMHPTIKKNSLVYGNNGHVENYAWKLENIKKYDKKIKVNGKLGLWNYEK